MSGPLGKSSEKSTSSSRAISSGANLEQLAHGFATEIAETLENVLPQAPPTDVVAHENRYVIRPGAEDGQGDGTVPLLIQGERAASLTFSILCRLDSAQEYLAVESSTYSVLADVDRTPILRFDYERTMHTAPHAHLHVHAHRGALSHLLSKAGHDTPHDMSSLHLPVGGSRFRPSLEDLLQFLIAECRFDCLDGWMSHIEAGRERWRRRQVAAIVRAIPSEAARVLRELGYEVEPPSPAPEDNQNALTRW